MTPAVAAIVHAVASPSRRSRAACAALIFLATFALHAALLPSQGLTDDDDFYAPAGISYAHWLGEVFTAPATAFSRGGVDAAFRANHEHPPVAKVVFGVAHAVAHGAFGDLDAARLGCAAFAAAVAALLVLLLWDTLGRAQALAAPVLLLSLPRFFFHSEVATLDVPVAFAVLAVTAVYFFAEAPGGAARHGRAWAPVVAGVVFGLALGVKLNAPFAVVPCALWSLLGRWRGFRVEGASLVIPPVPRSLVWMIVLGPLVFVATWPWLWFDTLQRLGAYVAFHLHHYPIYLFYDGEIWDKPFAPWHAVLFLGFGSIPLPVVALGLLGAWRGARALARIARLADDEGGVPDVTRGDKLRALLLLQAAFSMLVVMNPGIPRYGGEKLFMPLFPLWCALAADGAVVVARATLRLAAGAAARRRRPDRRRVAFAAAVVVALACAPGVAGTARFFGGYALSYYGELLGGLRGAVARGDERTYYDVADKPLARLLDAQCARQPTMCAVHFEPNHKEYVRTYRWLQRDGVISSKLKLVGDLAHASVVVLTHERRWSTYPALKAELEHLTPITEKAVDGVPLYTVYRR